MHTLQGVNGEWLLVVRTMEEEDIWSCLRRLRKDKRLREDVLRVEEELNARVS